MKKEILDVQGFRILILEDEFISLTDIARRFDPEEPSGLINNWMRLKDTVELLGAWETLHNPQFNPVEFDKVKSSAGSNRFRLSPSKWKERTAAIGFLIKMGRHNSGTFAHKDLALAFCSWVNPVFHLYVVKEFQRLKMRENPEWDMRRALSKVNYQFHTDAIRKHILPQMKGKPAPAGEIAFAEEADLLNLVVFGKKAEQWRIENPDLVAKGYNMRDFADIYELLVLANLEAYHETLIHYKMDRESRFLELQTTAQRQLEALYSFNLLPLEAIQSPLRLPQPGISDVADDAPII